MFLETNVFNQYVLFAVILFLMKKNLQVDSLTAAMF